MTARTPRVYLTLRCNLKCWYCSNGFSVADYEELTANEWVGRIQSMPESDVVLTGGEPTLHPEFYGILNALAPFRAMWVYSNFVKPLDVSRVPVQARIVWRASCHAQGVKQAEDWVANVSAARQLGQRMILTTVHCPPEVLDVLRSHSVCVDTPQEIPPPLLPPVRCTLDRILVAPDGNRYHCVGKLVRKEPTGIVPYADGNTVICQAPHLCATCDSVASQRSPME